MLTNTLIRRSSGSAERGLYPRPREDFPNTARCPDGITPFVIEERGVQRLMYIANPVSWRFQCDQLARVSLLFCVKNFEVVQDRGKHARVSQRAQVRGKSFGIQRTIASRVFRGH
jgi:hypothetical protein